MSNQNKNQTIVGNKAPEYISTTTKFTLETIKDSIVEQVKTEFDERSARGQAKYGTTLTDNNTDDFFQHLKEELMDAVLYLQKLQTKNNNNK